MHSGAFDQVKEEPGAKSKEETENSNSCPPPPPPLPGNICQAWEQGGLVSTLFGNQNKTVGLYQEGTWK